MSSSLLSLLNQPSTRSLKATLSTTLRLCVFALLLFVPLTIAQAQQVSNQAQQALQERGLDINKALNLAEQAGINPNDTQAIVALARAQGASEAEIQLLREELTRRNGGNAGTTGNLIDNRTPFNNLEITPISSDSTTEERSEADKKEPELNQGLEYFGYSIFQAQEDRFAPPSNTAVGDNYVVGNEDELRIIIWGDSELEYQLTVDKEGRINVPTIGPIMVAGKSLAQLRSFLRTRMSDSFEGLVRLPATTFLDVSVARAQNIRVYVLGEVSNAGGYTISFGSDVFNALYAAGGPTLNGSLRAIKIIRNGEVVEEVDLYRLLIEGKKVNEFPLRSNDRILVPPRINTVQIEGAVRRSAIYELNTNESIKELISYASGLKANASTSRYLIERIFNPAQRSSTGIVKGFVERPLAQDLANGNFPLQDGDKITIDGLTASLQNAVVISGAVYKSGTYELDANLKTLKDLIERADGLQDNAWMGYASLVRTQKDSVQKQLQVNVEDIMADVPQANILLENRDKLVIYAYDQMLIQDSVLYINAFEDSTVLPYRKDMTVYDVLFQSDNLYDAEYQEKIFLERADIERISEDGNTRTIIPFNLGKLLFEESSENELLIQPNDIVRVYPNTIKVITNQFVEVFGEVNSPRRITYSDGMTLQDAIIQARGFTESVYLADVEISRVIQGKSSRSNTPRTVVERLNYNLISDYDVNEVPFYNESLLDGALAQAEKIALEHRDKIYFRRHPAYRVIGKVAVTGEMNFPGSYTLEKEGEMLSSVIKRAGGISEEGYAGGARLLRDGSEIAIELDRIIEGSKQADIMLIQGDTLNIPKERFTVEIIGNVPNPTQIKFIPGKRLSYYIGRAGGLAQESYKYVQLTQGNGATYSVKRKGLFKDNPKVTDHSVIRVVKQDAILQKEKRTVREIVAESTALLTSTLTIVLLLNQVR